MVLLSLSDVLAPDNIILCSVPATTEVTRHYLTFFLTLLSVPTSFHMYEYFMILLSLLVDQAHSFPRRQQFCVV